MILIFEGSEIGYLRFITPPTTWLRNQFFLTRLLVLACLLTLRFFSWIFSLLKCFVLFFSKFSFCFCLKIYVFVEYPSVSVTPYGSVTLIGRTRRYGDIRFLIGCVYEPHRERPHYTHTAYARQNRTAVRLNFSPPVYLTER